MRSRITKYNQQQNISCEVEDNIMPGTLKYYAYPGIYGRRGGLLSSCFTLESYY